MHSPIDSLFGILNSNIERHLNTEFGYPHLMLTLHCAQYTMYLYSAVNDLIQYHKLLVTSNFGSHIYVVTDAT